LWVVMLAYICMFGAFFATMLLVPLLMEFETFGLTDPDSVLKTRENLASAVSLVVVPNGILNLACSTVGFLLVSSRIGDRNTGRLGGVTVAIIMSIFGFVGQKLWQLMILHAITGAGTGMFVPALTPTLQRYSGLAHPTKTAQASAMPMFGMQIGMMLGPSAFAALVGSGDRNRMNLCWLAAGSLFFVGFCACELAFALMARHPALRREQLTPEQIRVMVETKAEDEAQFVDEMCTLLRKMLTKGDPEYRNLRLWSGDAQRFLKRRLSESIPMLRPFDEATGGKEYFEDIGAWVLKAGTEEEWETFKQRFPHLLESLEEGSVSPTMTHNDLGVLDLSVGGTRARTDSQDSEITDRKKSF